MTITLQRLWLHKVNRNTYWNQTNYSFFMFGEYNDVASFREYDADLGTAPQSALMQCNRTRYEQLILGETNHKLVLYRHLDGKADKAFHYVFTTHQTLGCDKKADYTYDTVARYYSGIRSYNSLATEKVAYVEMLPSARLSEISMNFGLHRGYMTPWCEDNGDLFTTTTTMLPTTTVEDTVMSLWPNTTELFNTTEMFNATNITETLNTTSSPMWCLCPTDTVPIANVTDLWNATMENVTLASAASTLMHSPFMLLPYTLFFSSIVNIAFDALSNWLADFSRKKD